MGGTICLFTRISPMINAPWLNRAAALTVIVCVYILGYVGGKDNAIQAHHNHPACYQNLKP